MKQQITMDQWKALPEETRKKLLLWIQHRRAYNKNGHYHPTMSIGAMLELLYQNVTVLVASEERESPNQGWTVNNTYVSKELCDALWEAVQDVVIKL